jgi:hypothetical protein
MDTVQGVLEMLDRGDWLSELGRSQRNEMKSLLYEMLCPSWDVIEGDVPEPDYAKAVYDEFTHRHWLGHVDDAERQVLTWILREIIEYEPI